MAIDCRRQTRPPYWFVRLVRFVPKCSSVGGVGMDTNKFNTVVGGEEGVFCPPFSLLLCSMHSVSLSTTNRTATEPFGLRRARYYRSPLVCWKECLPESVGYAPHRTAPHRIVFEYRVFYYIRSTTRHDTTRRDAMHQYLLGLIDFVLVRYEYVYVLIHIFLCASILAWRAGCIVSYRPVPYYQYRFVWCS